LSKFFISVRLRQFSLKLDNTAGPVAYSIHASQPACCVIKPLRPMIPMSAAACRRRLALLFEWFNCTAKATTKLSRAIVAFGCSHDGFLRSLFSDN
jgi:hypothetical protein